MEAKASYIISKCKPKKKRGENQNFKFLKQKEITQKWKIKASLNTHK